MSQHIFTVVVRDMAHPSCSPSVVLFEDEGLAVHYIYNVLPALISAEVGFDVYLRSDISAPLFTKMRAVAVNPAYDAQISVTLQSQFIHSRSQP